MADNINLTLGKPKYFSAIDGLRLLASVNVVLFHLQYIGGLHDMSGNPVWFFRLIKGPAFHASLFFILGGFIFATKFAPKMVEGSFKSRPFLKKRFAELYPLHLITTLTMAALYIIRRWGTDGIDIPKLCYSLFMHLSFLWSICPLGTLTLNTPSWALSAMFLCYLLFAPLLKWALSLKSRGSVLLWIILFITPLVAWGLLYGKIGSPEKYYQLFHGFAPIRFFEFGLGVLLARFLMLKDPNKRQRPKLALAVRCDLIIVLVIGLIYYNLSVKGVNFWGVSLPAVRTTPEMKWFSYHVFMIPLYLLIIYTVSKEKGVFARILSLKFIQKLGRTSFYPYLLHIPLISIITTYCERVMGYRKFLHNPWNILVFMLLLYGCSYLYVYAVRNKRREKRARAATK